MEKLSYIELIQNNTVLVRERTQHALHQRVLQEGVITLLNSPNVRLKSYITNIEKPVGSIFSASI